MTNTIFNHEIKVFYDLRYRYANIQCKGSYGVNPAVTMLTKESTMRDAFILDVDAVFEGEEIKRFLIIESEYGHKVKLPFDKIIGMDILSNTEQAKLESYLRNKDKWEQELKTYEEIINKGTIHEESMEMAKEMAEHSKKALDNGKKLIEQGVKTYK